MKRVAAGLFCLVLLMALVACETHKTGTGTAEEEGIGTTAETGGEVTEEGAEGETGSTEGTGTSTTTTAKNYDPCILVTKAEAEAALGGAKLVLATHNTEPVQGVPLGQKTCMYNTSDLPFKTVMLTINEQALFTKENYTAEQLFNDRKTDLGDAVAIGGLGDGAYHSPKSAGAGVYSLKKDKGVVMSIWVSITDMTQRIDAEKGLTQKALERL